MVLASFGKVTNCDPETFCNFPIAIRLLSSRVLIQVHVCLVLNFVSFLLHYIVMGCPLQVGGPTIFISEYGAPHRQIVGN